MAMYNPPHPGEVIREDILASLELSIRQMAQHLGVNEQTLSVVLDERGPVTPELAYRLSLLFKPSAESWLRQQAAYDLWQLRERSSMIHVIPVQVYAV